MIRLSSPEMNRKKENCNHDNSVNVLEGEESQKDEGLTAHQQLSS